MSQRCIGYEGDGKHRRPVYLDEGPASVAADPLAALSNGGLPHLAVPHRGAGEVEISRIEVDEETRAAARAARTAVGQPMYVATPSDRERALASRHRGGQVNRDRIAAQGRETAMEEVPVDEDPPIWTHQTEPVENSLAVLGDAVAAAAEAWLAKLQADHLADVAAIGWSQARAALDAAYRALDDPPPGITNDASPLPAAPAPSVAAPSRVVRPRSRVGEGQRPGQASERDKRAALVMASMARHGDDQAAVAAELGMKKNAVAMIVKHARRRDAQPVATA